MKRQKPTFFILILSSSLFSIFFGAFLTYFLLKNFTSPLVTDRNKESTYESRTSFNYKYINPLLECELGNEIENTDLRSFKDDIYALTEKLEKEKMVNRISVYYRDLNNGPWWGINERYTYDLASLVKLPMMISFLEKVQDNSVNLDQKITFDVDESVQYSMFPNEYAPSQQLEVGEEYSLEEILKRMIVYSDNYAYGVLNKYASKEEFERIYRNMGINYKLTENGRYILDAKQFSSLFRVLFNASYLGKDASEYALNILSQTDYRNGLRAGVPADVNIAHKYGIYIDASSGLNNLHDCGIVYYPKHPYVLCLMAEGSNLSKIEASLSEISKAVYTSIDKKYATVEK